MTRRHLLPLVTAIALASIPGQAASARTGGRPEPLPPGTSPPERNATTLSGVTIDGQQSPRQLRERVDHFVAGVLVRSPGESLGRWNTGICPVVEGLSPDSNEVIRTRVLQTAVAAHVRVGGKHCRTNLYVIASDQPDQLLKELWAHTPTMFYHLNGLGGVGRYLHSERPVRAWYNIDQTCREGPDSASPAAAALMGSPLESFTENSQGSSICSGGSSPLSHEGVQSISSAIIVADTARTQGVTIAQLADYVALIALADVDPDADVGTVPTILRLFQATPADPAQAFSAWDRALLYSLYNTTQSNTMQLSTVETTVVRRLSSKGEEH